MSSTYQHAWNTAKEIYLQQGREEGREENIYQLAMKVKSAHTNWTLNQIADYLFVSPNKLNQILDDHDKTSRK